MTKPTTATKTRKVRESSVDPATSVAKRIVREGIDFGRVTSEVAKLGDAKFDKLRKSLGKAGFDADAIERAVTAARTSTGAAS